MDEKKIETIIRDMVQSYFACYNDIPCGECEQKGLCSHYRFASNLVKLNYRKESDTAREILQAVDNESNGQTVAVTNVLRKRYGVKPTEDTTANIKND